jgi:hypothetical protein
LIEERTCSVEEADSPHGVIIDVPRGFCIHLFLRDDGGFDFRGFTADSAPIIERLYPQLAAAAKGDYKTKKAGWAAVKEAVKKECKGPVDWKR